MSVLSWPDHLVTLDEWILLPEDNRFHVELVQGVLLVSPRSAWRHQEAVLLLASAVRQHLPAHLRVAPEIEVVVEVDPDTVRVPDLVVAPAEVTRMNPARLQAQDVLLAVEILSRGTKRTDQVTKFDEYADAGIKSYWLVDLTTPITLSSFALVDGHYELTGEHTGDSRLELDGAVITIDLETLVGSDQHC
jgi:Uma2 family endonuclease